MGLHELWGCANQSNISIIRIIPNALWCVSNRTLHMDTRIPYIEDQGKQSPSQRQAIKST